MSIGSKFNLVALGIPVAVLLAMLGLIYWMASNLFQPSLVLVGGFVALDGVVWNRLRSHLETKMRQIWEHYLKPIRDREAEVALGLAYFFPNYGWGLEPKMEWVLKYGKYGPIKLYPKRLAKHVPKLVSAGEDFNSKLNEFLATTRASSLQPELYFAFDHWGFRKISPDEMKRQGDTMIMPQKKILDTLDKTKKQEIADLTQSWEKALSLSKQVVSTLDKFSSENGIMPPNPTPFVPVAHY